MLNIVICDDNFADRKIIKDTVDKELCFLGYDYKLDEYKSGEEFIYAFKNMKIIYDIIFLDIEMNKLNGIEVAKEIRKLNDGTIIIFITGYTDYVFAGYEVHAYNYILKPFKNEKLKAILKEACYELESKKSNFFMISIKNKIIKINYSNIFYFESSGRKIKLYSSNGIFEFYYKLVI